MKKQELLQLISEFIDRKDPSKSCPDGYDDVDHLDMITMRSIFNGIIEQRFHRDVDGDLPINYQLVNRNNEEFILHNNTVSYGASLKKLHRLTTASRFISSDAQATTAALLNNATMYNEW